MSTAPASTWAEDNQQGLVCELARVRTALVRHAPRGDACAGTGATSQSENSHENGSDTAQAVMASYPETSSTAAPGGRCAIFSLSPFERDVLLLCAGIELDSAFAVQCG